jgi:hypothetical protein
MKRLALVSTAVLAALAFVPVSAEARASGDGFHRGVAASMVAAASAAAASMAPAADSPVEALLVVGLPVGMAAAAMVVAWAMVPLALALAARLDTVSAARMAIVAMDTVLPMATVQPPAVATTATATEG